MLIEGTFFQLLTITKGVAIAFQWMQTDTVLKFLSHTKTVLTFCARAISGENVKWFSLKSNSIRFIHRLRPSNEHNETDTLLCIKFVLKTNPSLETKCWMEMNEHSTCPDMPQTGHTCNGTLAKTLSLSAWNINQCHAKWAHLTFL